ncbi:alpha/beta hydrolase [Pandoraea communis]|uniref:alpha/beta hydrolase n=1 Tax=Pandoraea communis TaxID=2508297 RepID=UPI0025A61D7D|nr:alpha/beta hydrolase [Pandoraea communis]MDM8354955.1 alpha/beta hydrolase [Pandoraea communis]
MAFKCALRVIPILLTLVSAMLAAVLSGPVSAKSLDAALLNDVPVCKPLPDIQRFLDSANSRPNPLDSLTPDSVVKLRESRDRAALHPLREIKLKKIEDVQVPSEERRIPVRIYVPEDERLARGGKLPVVMFIHGGGWTLGSVTSYDSITRELSRAIPAIVVSVDYRLAPEHPFPAGFDDAFAALQWIGGHIGEYGGDASRVAIAGDSGGGNLSVAVATRARHEGSIRVAQQILFYPSTNISSTATQSYKDFGERHLLTTRSVESFRDFYLPNVPDRTNTYASPLLAQDLKGMPRTLLVTAGCDPLRDEGYAFAERLEKAGVPVVYRNTPGLIHAFLNFFNQDPVISPYAQAVLDYAASVIRQRFE